MELRPYIHLLGVALFALGVILPLAIGFFAEKLYRTRLYGRAADALIGLAGGCIPGYIVYKLIHVDVADFSQPLATVERMIDQNALKEAAIFCVVTVVGAVFFLFAFRLIGARKPA